MNRNALIGAGVGVVVVIAAALVYFFVLGGGKPGPTSDDVAARAAAFWQGINKVPGATLKVGKATAGDGPEGLVMRDYELSIDTAKSGGNAGTITVKVGEINIKRFDWAAQKAGKAPKWADITFKDITIPMESMPAQAQMGLRLVGIQGLTLNGVYRYSFDEKAKTLNAPALNIELKDQAALEFRLRANNVDAKALEKLSAGPPQKMDEETMKTVGSVELAGFRLAVINKGLAQKLLTTMATFQGGDAAKAKAKLIQQLETQAENSPSKLVKEALGAAVAFIKDPKSFIIEAAPAQPVSLEKIQSAAKENPDNLKVLLNLRFVAE